MQVHSFQSISINDLKKHRPLQTLSFDTVFVEGYRVQLAIPGPFNVSPHTSVSILSHFDTNPKSTAFCSNYRAALR